MKIGVVAASTYWPDVETVRRGVTSLVERDFAGRAEVWFHPGCGRRSGHFSGADAERAEAFVEVANDPSFDALWFGRGGYGAIRILDMVLPRLTDVARNKTYLGYSDAGAMLAALYAQRYPGLAHGPMPRDLIHYGEAPVRRALAWLVDRDPAALEPTLPADAPVAAFNLAVLSSVVGTPHEPDLTGHVLMLEEVGEYAYGFDRYLFHVLGSPNMRGLKAVRLGRFDPKPNNIAFGEEAEAIVRYACQRAGVAFDDRPADIGHDALNRVVPFGHA